MKHNVLVANISDEGIIGYDFLYTHGCTIDAGQHEFTLQGRKIPCTAEGGTQGNARLSLIEVPREEALEKIVEEEEEQNREGEVEITISPYLEADGFPLAENLCECLSEENRDYVILVRDDVFISPESEQLIDLKVAYCATGEQETTNVHEADDRDPYISKSRSKEAPHSQTTQHRRRDFDQMSPGSGDLMEKEAQFVKIESVSPEDCLMCALGAPVKSPTDPNPRLCPTDAWHKKSMKSFFSDSFLLRE